MKNRSHLLLAVLSACCVVLAVGQTILADTSISFDRIYTTITAGFHKRLSTHPAGAYGGHVIGVYDAENPLDDHTTPRADQIAGFNATWTLGYIETGFGATTFVGKHVYTARDNLTVDFLTLTNEPANQVNLPMEGPECQRRLFTDTLYEALSGGFPPQDAIYTVKVSQQPEPPSGANNAGGFIRMTPSIHLSTWNTLDDYYVCVGCTNGTKLNLGGDPVRLSQGVMVLEVKTVENGGRVKIYDGNTLLIDGTGTKEWPLSGTFRMENVPSPLRVVGKTVSANNDDVEILYKYMWGSEVWTVATEKMTVLKVQINQPIEVTRGECSPITATLTTDLTPDKVEWIFTGGAGGTKESTPYLCDTVTLVDGTTSYQVKCRVTIGSTICEDSAPISVLPRSWTLTPTCAPDNDPNWGTYPDWYTEWGWNRDRVSGENRIITPKTGGFTSAQVDDYGGPNDGYWYIQNTELAIDMETVINKHAKSSVAPPTPPGIAWRDYNIAKSVDVDGRLIGLKAHEYMGSATGTGHQSLLEASEAEDGNDINTLIEDNWSATSKDEVETETETEKTTLESILYPAMCGTPHACGNWGPANIFTYSTGEHKWIESADAL